MPKMEELQRNLILINAEGLKITGLRMTFSGSLMEKNGYLESCHQLNPNNGRNKTTGEPTEPLFVGCLHL